MEPTPEARGDMRIELVEIKTDAASVIDYLNGLQPEGLTPLRTWKLSVRGGLIELNADGTIAKAAEQGE
jgi:hypothetical protein